MIRNIIFALLLMGMETNALAAPHHLIKKVDFDFDKLSITEVKGDNGVTYSKIKYDAQSATVEEFGYPELPICYITMPIPEGAVDIQVDVLSKDIRSFLLDHPVFPVQEPATTSLQQSRVSFSAPVDKIYTAESSFPTCETFLAYTGVIYDTKSKSVTIGIYPVVYIPKNLSVDFIESITISLSYSVASVTKTPADNGVRTATDLPYYEYCVITPEVLAASFNRIIAWKKTKGINAGLIKLEQILNNASLVGDTISNIYDNAGKIRQYLQRAWKSGIAKYVLFGGNASNMPIRYGTLYEDTWSFDNNSIGGKVPADFYFSELESNWNQDNDIYYGETGKPMDYGPELFVGRLLCENTAEVGFYTDKLLKYEMNPGNGYTQYLKRAFYSQSDQMRDQNQAQKLIDSCYNVFSVNTILSELPNGSDENPSFPSGTDVIDAMNTTRYGYFNWLGHGHPLAIGTMSKAYGGTPHYGITSIQGNIIYIQTESGNGLDNLTNENYPAIAYSIACTVAPYDIFHSDFEGYPNVAQSFTLGEKYGGPAFIGNTRVGYIYYSYRLQQLFNSRIRNYTLGEALAYAKNAYSIGLKHQMVMTTNLIGCPELKMWTNVLRSVQNVSRNTVNTTDYQISFTSQADSVIVGVRDVFGADNAYTLTCNSGTGTFIVPNGKGKQITLMAQNYRPKLLLLENDDAEVHGERCIIAQDVTLGGGTETRFEVENDADVTIWKSGVLRLMSGVKIKQGAEFSVK